MAITKVYLLSVPLEKDYSHTLWFASESAQLAYFMGQKKADYSNEDFTYQRKDGVIRVPEQIDTLWANGINYVMYQNTAYNNKWFYAFITDMQYINDGRTDITIQTDCLQTWMFEKVVKPSFVEREHAKTDEIGDHTIDEGLELGEYICQAVNTTTELTEYQYVILTTAWTTTVNDNDDRPLAVNMGGIFYAGGAYICDTMEQVVNILQVLANNAKSDAVYAVYMIPKKIVNNTSGAMQFSGQTDPVKFDETANKPSYVGSKYVEGFPKNNKLFCYPYCYLLVSNNAGSSSVYKYERFADQLCRFKIYGAPVVGGSIKCVPQNYNGITDNQEEGIMCGKFPTLSWSQDMFTNWLTQNSVNIAIGVGSGALQVVGGVVMAAASGGIGAAMGGASIVGGINEITRTLAQRHQQSLEPAAAKGNTNAGDINTAAKANTFYFYRMSIKDEYARQIDEYFTMFGYKCNRVKTPEENHRKNFWYTKTIAANITGEIPQADLQTIKDCYNRGITYWKTPANFKDYTVANGTV